MINRSENAACLRSCCIFIFTSCLTSLFLCLSLLSSNNPICSIERFDAFALNKTSNSISSSISNHTLLHYDLKLKNKNKERGIYYDALNLTFYYKPNLTSSYRYPIGNATYPAFYQGRRRSTYCFGSFDATRGVNWENATGRAVFRVELATAVRFKIIFWKTKRHRLMVGADFQVNDQGSLVKRKKNKGIKLSSQAAAKIKAKGWFHLVGILGIFSFLNFC